MVTTNANHLPNRMRAAFILSGLGRVQRGAETAFLELARHLKKFPDVNVDLFGSGNDYPEGLNGRVINCWPREKFERWPKIPPFRTDYVYEEAGFVMKMLSRRVFDPKNYDIAVHCSFPFVNWFLRKVSSNDGPVSVFVTQNGDWMCRAESSEYRTFQCGGLVCTNPEYFERHSSHYQSCLIPNGVDPDVYRPLNPGEEPLKDPRLPDNKRIILMASALIPSKRVAEGIRSMALVSNGFLVIAGDGPLRKEIQELAAHVLPGRHLLLGSVQRDEMPAWYRRADAFLHTSQDEPFGIVYLEAAASGLPIVAHHSTVPRWILGDTARYADSSDMSALGRELRSVLQPEIGRALGAAARERIVADWSWDAQAAKYRAFLYACRERKAQEKGVCA